MSNGGIDGVVESRAVTARRHYAMSRAQRKEARTFRVNFNAYQTNKYYVSRSGYSIAPASIFSVIFVLLAVINFFYASVGFEQTFTFSHMLEKFSTIEPVGIEWIRDFAEMRIEEDWSVFNWFRDFLNNFIMKLVTAFLFLCTGLVELIRYAYFFVGILFGW